MNLAPTDQVLQLITWLIALIELIGGLYILLLNFWHTASRHVSVFLFLTAIIAFAAGLLLGAADAAQAAWPTRLLAATSAAAQPLTILVTIALLKPEWLRGRWQWLRWLLSALVALPAVLTLSDVGLGTGLWYTGLSDTAYAGGYAPRVFFVNGSLKVFLDVVSLYLLSFMALIPTLYVALRDKKASPLTRRLAWLILVPQIVATIIWVGLRDVFGEQVSMLISGAMFALVYAYAAFRQMSSERRAHTGRLQPRLTAQVLAVALPVLAAVVFLVSSRAGDLLKQRADEELQATSRALAANVSVWLRLNVDALHQLVSLPDIRSMDPGRQEVVLKATSGAYPHLFLVQTTNLLGMNVARNDDQEDEDFSDQAWFLGANAGNPTTFQSLPSHTTGKPALIIAAPIRDTSGVIVGVGSIVSELDDLSREVQVSQVGETGFAYLVDANNQVVAHPDPIFSAELRDLSAYAPIVALRQGARGLMTFTDDQGRRWRAYVDELDNGWGVVVQQPEAEALTSLRHFQRISWTVMALGAALLLALTWLTTRQAFRPISALTDTAAAIAAGDLTRIAPVESEDEFGMLARAFNRMTEQLRGLISSLEQHVLERTTDLERRSNYLEAAAEVSRAATSILEPDQLIGQVVELIRERFDLYYVGLFLVDEAHKWAVLRTGTGEAGRAMLARGHRIKVGEGMVGWSVATGQARVALEAGADAIRLATAELPETRSEAAIPLRSRGQVLGALTVQDSRPGAFDRDAIAAFQAIADQVAVALDNARLFAENQAALDATRRAYGQLSQQAWAELLHARTNWGYRYTQNSVIPTTNDWQPETLQAVQTGQMAQSGHQSVQRSPASLEEPGLGGNETEVATLAVPLKVRDQVIGVLSFRRGESDQAWAAEEIALLKTLAEQLAVALESARLYQDVQRRAERERLTTQVTTRMRETLDIETVLKTAVQEVRQALGLSEVVVRLVPQVSTQADNGGE